MEVGVEGKLVWLYGELYDLKILIVVIFFEVWILGVVLEFVFSFRNVV